MVSRRHFGLTVAGAVLFAQSAVLTKASGAEFAAATFFRCAYAVPVLMLWAYLAGRRGQADPKISRSGVLAGVLFCGNLLCWNAAIGLIGASLAAVMGNVQVVMVALCVWMIDGQRPRPAFWAALPVMICGAALIAGPGLDPLAPASATGTGLAGTLLCLASASFGAACLLVLSRLPHGRRGQVAVLRDMTAMAAVLSLCWALATEPGTLTVSADSHLLLLILAISSQVLAWALYNRGLLGISPVLAALISLGQPVLTAAAAAVVLREQLEPQQLLGSALVLTAVAWLSWMDLRQAKPMPAQPSVVR